ncbi:transposable element Tcb1 transposase [Trichonephila clavipes]|nr:transposable element Tcb1 transposase [Trichonephila clavipes]
MSPRKQRSAFDQVSEFDRGRIVAYRDCGLSFRKIGSPVGRNQTGLSARRPLLGLPLMQNQRRLRHQWCDERRMWVKEWNEVVSTDESRICLQHHDDLNGFPGRLSSPDLPPIENMVSMVAQRLTQITPPATTPDQHCQRVEASLSAVPEEHIQSLFESMRRHVASGDLQQWQLLDY